MKGLPCSIEVSLLDWEDRTFAVRRFSPSDRLDASLDRFGFLFAPWVWARQGQRYVIVDGFKRLRWAREKGQERVECILFPEESDPAQLMIRCMEAKVFGAPLNVAERAQVVAKLASVLSPEEVMARIFSALRIPLRPEAFADWCRLAEAGESVLNAAASEAVSERALLELVKWEGDARPAMLALLGELRCSVSIQMEILERTTEIALGRGIQRADLLRDIELTGILNDPHLNHRQKTLALREMLGRWRFPRLRAREERFARELSMASLPRSLRLTPPRYFEGEEWQLQVSFSRPEELESLLEQARTFALSSGLRTIME